MARHDEIMHGDVIMNTTLTRDCDRLSLMLGAHHNDGRLKQETFTCLQVTDDMLTRHDTLRVVTRAYLEPETTTGPSYDELAWPSVTEFSCS